MRTISFGGTIGIIVWLCLLAIPVLASENSTENTSYKTIVVLPDTQFYSEKYPDIFKVQTQWIADNAESENITVVVHVGDVVQNSSSDAEWGIANEALGILASANISYIVAPGNHDISSTAARFLEYVGPLNSSHEVDIWGGQFLVVALNGYEVGIDETVTWANNLLEQNRDKKVIIAVHGYIWQGGGKLHDPYGESGLYLWGNVISKYNNIVAVFCGHLDEEGWSQDKVGESIINNFLSDFQARENGGNGWLRLYRFYESMDRIDVLTYSPLLDQYETDYNSQFTASMLELTAPAQLPSPWPAENRGWTPPGNVSQDGGNFFGGYTADARGAPLEVVPITGGKVKVRMLIDTANNIYMWKVFTSQEYYEFMVDYTIDFEQFYEKYGLREELAREVAIFYHEKPTAPEFRTLKDIDKQNLMLIWEYMGK